ncbi:hypothetical protein BLNAU_18922 [Blattamonas nauphoetae]|uniref:Uncharacterized protein n=1 Tax=Blattamonas nauphoetae TaxID=2049346 RepID=A0ABQ9X347_9EUKA|nr:hypothetical protein BLNAU_18922 [Blattamonas nauphoetae]
MQQPDPEQDRPFPPPRRKKSTVVSCANGTSVVHSNACLDDHNPDENAPLELGVCTSYSRNRHRPSPTTPLPSCSTDENSSEWTSLCRSIHRSFAIACRITWELIG